MGILVVARPIPDGSPYTNLVVYSASTRDGSYSSLNTDTGQVISSSGLIYYHAAGTESTWYKYKYYDSSGETYSGYSDPVKGSILKYTSTAAVSVAAQVTTFSETTTPKLSTIAQWIKEAQDFIDNETGHAWRERFSGTEGGEDQTQRYEYYDINLAYESRTGVPIYLKNRKVKDFDTTEGDVIEIWNGSSWYDWTANRTEGRDSDYWLDNENGVLYVKTFMNYQRSVAVRLKYRYGEVIVNDDIRRACTLLVASNLQLSDNGAVIMPEGESSFSISDRYSKMRQEALRIIDKYREFKVPAVAL